MILPLYVHGHYCNLLCSHVPMFYSAKKMLHNNRNLLEHIIQAFLLLEEAKYRVSTEARSIWLLSFNTVTQSWSPDYAFT